jgi:hypothetical protein
MRNKAKSEDAFILCDELKKIYLSIQKDDKNGNGSGRVKHKEGIFREYDQK